jgi:DNA-binding MarR family transcriptional regulator
MSQCVAPASRRNERNSPLEEAYFFISRAFYAYVGYLERLLEELGLDEHLRPGMGHVLFALFETDDVIIKDLVRRTHLAPSTLGRLLREMERAGLLGRSKCGVDGRAVRIQLTPLARSLEGRCYEAARRLKEVSEAGLSRKEVQAVNSGLSRIIQNLQPDAECRR